MLERPSNIFLIKTLLIATVLLSVFRPHQICEQRIVYLPGFTSSTVCFLISLLLKHIEMPG